MQGSVSPTDRTVESLLAFWRDAGVDVLFDDEPVSRRRPPEARVAPQAVRPTMLASTSASAQPTDLGAAVAEARRAAGAAANLEELAQAIAGFEGCPLRLGGAPRSVFARGNGKADVIVIGEAPGPEEDSRGEPFVGRAGMLLDRMLAAAGLSERVFITNTVYWRPQGNRSPTPQEQLVCAPFVERTITLIRPRILLLVGAAAARSLLKNTEGILALRGNWFEWRDESGEFVAEALPTLHPAFLLRQPAAKKRSWADLLSLADRLDRTGATELQTET